MSTTVRNNSDQSRYEVFVDGELRGFADYRVDGDTVTFPHTVIDPSHRGHGLGAALVAGALADVRPTGRRVVPLCWYVAQYIDEHPREADLLEVRDAATGP